mmetsp:Transcript_30305/g.70782  ORF Transcript_30305/g.70782 Transcript_30305/m.70782 type:complete len:179 (-) Transcript_30305:26-562(-)
MRGKVVVLVALGCLVAPTASFSPSLVPLAAPNGAAGAGRALCSSGDALGLSRVPRLRRGGRGSLGVVAALDPGKEGFDSIQKRLRKLEKEADGYKDTDQADLAEGLKDDIQETKERLEKARKDSKARVLRTIAMGAAAAAAIGAAVFAFGPRRAYAASITKDAARDVPTLSAGPVRKH